MDLEKIFAASRFGMSFERLRLEAAARNVAMANQPIGKDGGGPVRVTASGAPSAFAAMVGAATPSTASVRVTTDADAVRVVRDPGNPAADAAGNVRLPRLELADEMATMVSAGRAYEANVKALAALRDMMLRALEIGGGR